MDYFDDLEFVNSGHLRHTAVECRDRYFSGYYGIQFIRRGVIAVGTPHGGSWSAAGPVLFFTTPEQPFTYGTPSGTRDHLYVCFRGERTRRYLEHGLLPQYGGKNIPVADADELTDMLDRLLHTLPLQTRAAHGEAVLLLEKLLLYIACPPPQKRGTLDTAALTRLAAEIADQPGKDWDFAREAAKYRFSAVHFRRLFRQQTGIAPQHYVLQCRIRHACLLLVTTGMRIKEIAQECGFSGPVVFSRRFRSVMNASPEEFRRRG